MRNLTSVVLMSLIILAGCVQPTPVDTTVDQNQDTDTTTDDNQTTTTEDTNTDSNDDEGAMDENTETEPEPELEPNTITITSAGFSPNSLRIQINETVTWVNNDSVEHWVASAQHPLHTRYCGSSNCGMAGSYMGTQSCLAEGEAKDNAFDSCKGIPPGDSYEFTFAKEGTWFYHDHLNSTLFGSVTVER